MRTTSGGLVLLWLVSWSAVAAPYVAWVGDVPVHSASPAARVMVADLAGGAPVNVSQGLRAAREPAWAPDGTLLAFDALAEDGQNDLFVCHPDGSDRENLSQTADAWEAAPVFLDAQRLGCLVGVDRTEVWVIARSPRARTRLAAPAAFHARPVASADGRLLAVVASERLAGPGQLCLVPSDGSALRVLTPVPARYSVPAFTPDGQQLVYAFDGAEIDGAQRGVAIQPLAGGPARLLATDGYPLAALVVSPDGRQVAYTSAAVYHTTWVSLVGMEGGKGERLAVSGFHNIGWPGFTPDGRRLVFEGVYAARFTVNLLDLASGQVTGLTPDGDTGVHPLVSPR